MPELPDISIYIEALEARIVGEPLSAVRIVNPFVLRSVAPPVEVLAGRRVRGLRRMGKRIVMEFDPDLYLVIHLMIAGRLRWRLPGGNDSGDVARPGAGVHEPSDDETKVPEPWLLRLNAVDAEQNYPCVCFQESASTVCASA
jgi:formamidopyrimidine-DNA glycosylase